MQKIWWFLVWTLLVSNLVSTTYAQDSFIDQELLKEISSKITSISTSTINLEDKKQIIQAFCNKVKNTSFSQGSEILPSNQSLFLSILCNHNEVKADYFTKETLSYLKKDQDWDDTLVSYKNAKFTKACRSEYQDDCNIAELTEEIITQLFSELFTLKQAEIFGLTRPWITEESKLYEDINRYVAEKFAIPVKGKNGFCWDQKDTTYPQTCSIMKKQMKAFLSTIQKFKLLETQSLYATIANKNSQSDFLPCTSWRENNKEYDLILCGTLGDTDNGLKPFIHLLYNELTRYLTFTTYYEWILNERTEPNEALQDEIQHIGDSQEEILLLTNQTINNLVNLSVTYPLHIGMLAYQEDLLRFRDRLSKVVTPFYTLYHKLRNVQVNQ